MSRFRPHRLRSVLFAAGTACMLMPSLVLAQAQQPTQTTSQPANQTPAVPTSQSTSQAASAPVTLQKIDSTTGFSDQEDLVGKKAFDFTLLDSEGKSHTLSNYVKDGKIVVLEWFCPTCPFVKYHYERKTTMKDIQAKYANKDVIWLAINSGGDETSSGAALNEEARKAWKISYPVLLDATGKVGKAYGAKNTPTMYVIGADGTIDYAGAIDNRLAPDEPAYVERALKALTAGSAVQTPYAKPYGCSVKYGH